MSEFYNGKTFYLFKKLKLSKYKNYLKGSLFWFFLFFTAITTRGKSPEITIVWATENFVDGSRALEDENGNLISAGLAGNQNGANVELGYFKTASGGFVNDDNFSGIWTPLTYGTHVGDSSTGYGFGDGRFAFTTTFTRDSDSIVIYPTEPKEFSETLQQEITSQNPPPGTQIFIRFYSNSSRVPAERKYNTVTGSNWKWPSFPSGNSIPDNIYFKISDASSSNSTWKSGDTFEANDANDRFKTVLREKFDLYGMVKSDPSYGTGTVSLQGGVNNGNYEADYVQISAVADQNSSFFMYWEGDGITNSNSPNTTVYLNKDQNVTAVFSKNIYNVSITVIGKGSVSQNGVFQEENIYSHGDQLALVAFPNEGQDFKYWAYTNSPDHNLSTNLEENYTMVGNLDLIAVFEPRQYTLAFEPITSNTGEIEVFNSDGEKADRFFHGETYNLYAAPSNHYLFEKWTWPAGTPSPFPAGESVNNPTANISPIGDVNVSAVFIPILHTLNVTSTSGAANVSPSSGQYSALDQIPVTAEALEGYKFINWTDPFSILLDSSNATTEANMSKVNMGGATITAVFNPKEYNSTEVLASADESQGFAYLQSNQSGNYTHFEKYSLLATPAKGYRFLRWEGAGSENALIFGKYEKNNEVLIHGVVDINLTAIFEPSEYFIDVNASPSFAGSVLGYGGFTVLDTPSLTATPNQGWKFAGWSGDTDYLSDTNSSTTYVSTDDRNFSFTANFDALSYDVNLTALEGGTLDAFRDDNRSQMFATASVFHSESFGYSDNFSVNALQNEGWQFDQWLNLPAEFLEKRTTPSLSNIDVFEEMSISAKFKKISYDLEMNNTLGGSIIGLGSYDYEENVTISAIANEHFFFQKWKIISPLDLNTSFLSLTQQSQTFPMPASTFLLEAEFIPLTYQVTASASDTTLGSTSLSGTYASNASTGPDFNASSEILITAIPDNNNSIFTSWAWTTDRGLSGSSTNPSFRIPHLDDNYSFTANFTAKPSGYIDYNRSASPSIGGYIESNDSGSSSPWQKLTAVPYPGYSFIGWTAADENNNSITVSPHWSSHQVDLNISNSSEVVAHFAQNESRLFIEFNDSMGLVSGNQTLYDWNEQAEISATVNGAYSFSGWEIDRNLSEHSFLVTKGFSTLHSSDSRMFINGTEAPELALARGFTYRFDYNFSDDAFIFFSTSASAELDENYTTGVLHDTASNQMTFSVESSAPDYLYYHHSKSPYSGNRIKIIDINESKLLPAPTQPFANPSITADLQIRANFQPTTYTISSSVIGQGQVDVNTAEPYQHGKRINIFASPSINWEFIRWENGSLVDNPYDANTSFILNSNTELIALFQSKAYELSLPVEPAGFGTARSQFNQNRFGWGETVRIIAEPRTGKVFKHWLFEDNSTILENSIDITINSDTTVKAVFTPKTFSINLSVITLDENGSVLDSPTGGAVATFENTQDFSYVHEDTAELKSTPYAGFRFLRWETSDANTSGGNWTNEILVDQNLSAYFQRIPYSVQITSTDSSRGKLRYNENDYSEISKTMLYGDTLSLEAVSSEGYRFEKWLVVPDGSITNPKNSNLNLTIQKNMTITPLFVTVEDINITISIFPAEAGYSIGHGAFPYNESHPILAQNRKGWIFERWEGDDLQSTTSASTTVLLDKAKELKAFFKLASEDLSSSGQNSNSSFTGKNNLLIVTENEKSYGDATGSGFYGDEHVSIEASPFSGYEFVRWEGDGLTDKYSAKTQVLVQEKKTVTAYFQKLGLFEDSISVGNGWWGSGNFGFFFKIDGSEWFFHETLGWILMRQAEDNRNENDSFWIWIDRLGTWAWMKKSKYPHMYAQGTNLKEWIWIDAELSKYPKIVLYSFSKIEWIEY